MHLDLLLLLVLVVLLGVVVAIFVSMDLWNVLTSSWTCLLVLFVCLFVWGSTSSKLTLSYVVPL